MTSFLLLLFELCINILTAADTPNILFIIADDLPWGNVGFHSNQNDEIKTPNMNYLAQDVGLTLMRHYVHYVCLPTRSSFQSGRLPVHVSYHMTDGLKDEYQGISINMTCIATKLKNGANYSTHFVGKWDAGMPSWQQIPISRGYDTSFGYLSAANQYWTQQINDCNGITDLWANNKPAYNVNGTTYEEFLFSERVYSLIDEFGKNKENNQPFFLVYAAHLPHTPLNIPKDYLSSFENDENQCGIGSNMTPYIYPGFTNKTAYHCRSTLQSMVNLLDEIIGNITNKLTDNGLWNDTLIILVADNGGSEALNNTAGNNFPLRGGKFVPFEGGIRATSFVSGGYVPKERYGQKEYSMIHIADWYTTFCELAGIDPYDHKAKKYNLPPVDGLNIWPLISGMNSTSPRTEIPINQWTLIQNEYKLIVNTTVNYAGWGGKFFPNSTSYPNHQIEGVILDCHMNTGGCLFNVVDDMTEQINIGKENKDIVYKMNQRLLQLTKGYFKNNVSGTNSVCPNNINTSCGCWTALNYWGGFSGPYQDLPANQSALND